MAPHPKEKGSLASVSVDSVKKFGLPSGDLLHSVLGQQKTTVNSMGVNEDGVLATAGDDGSLWFWEWESGRNLQREQTVAQPGLFTQQCHQYYNTTAKTL